MAPLKLFASSALHLNLLLVSDKPEADSFCHPLEDVHLGKNSMFGELSTLLPSSLNVKVYNAYKSK